jgi:hypothetical protein
MGTVFLFMGYPTDISGGAATKVQAQAPHGKETRRFQLFYGKSGGKFSETAEWRFVIGIKITANIHPKAAMHNPAAWRCAQGESLHWGWWVLRQEPWIRMP